MPLLSESSSWASKLESPEEIVGLFEMRTNSVDLIDQIFNGVDSVLGETGIDEPVIGQGNSLVVNLAVSSLVNQFSDIISGGITELDIIFTRK